MCKYSKLNLNTFALFTLVHSQITVMQQLNAEVFKLSFEYLHIVDIAKLHHECLVKGQIYGKH